MPATPPPEQRPLACPNCLTTPLRGDVLGAGANPSMHADWTVMIRIRCASCTRIATLIQPVERVPNP